LQRVGGVGELLREGRVVSTVSHMRGVSQS
jgi:hypothetical protein